LSSNISFPLCTGATLNSSECVRSNAVFAMIYTLKCKKRKTTLPYQRMVKIVESIANVIAVNPRLIMNRLDSIFHSSQTSGKYRRVISRKLSKMGICTIRADIDLH